MKPGIGQEILHGFNVPEHCRSFLNEVVESSSLDSPDTRLLYDISLTARAEDWQSLIECARALQKQDAELGGEYDELTHIAFILGYSAPTLSNEPWAGTDYWIHRATKLANNSQGFLEQRQDTTVDKDAHAHFLIKESAGSQTANGRYFFQDAVGTSAKNLAKSRSSSRAKGQGEIQGNISPFFQTPPPESRPSKRFPAGTVSSVPFPPLTAPSFGLIQEQVAHEPFWLLVVVTFLIKTKGITAIPVFHRVRERFPSPGELGDPDNAEEIVAMIEHLGLGRNRLSFIQKYANAFLHQPPVAGVCYKVSNYHPREVNSSATEFVDNGNCQVNLNQANLQTWEIGHMTQGKYALDSWRIFCRDELLGRAQDCNGAGREPEFQPEWMRVLPTDKELRAYLRWMWMREGWEWDPVTGDRTVLRPNLERAVNDGLVEYDETGGLRIIS